MSSPKPIPDNPPRKDEQCEDNCPPCFPVVGTIRYRYDFLNSAAHNNKINKYTCTWCSERNYAYSSY